MGWRYRRSYKILPGLRMNVGSRGVTSFSLGGRGVTGNMSKRGAKTTYSLPGTGLSYQTRHASSNAIRPAISRGVTAPLSPAALAQTRSRKMYAIVGVGALVAYLALRPSAPGPQIGGTNELSAIRSAVQGPVVQPSLPQVISPAMAADVAAKQPTYSAERVTARAAITTTGANVRSVPSRSGAIVRVLEAGTSIRIIASEGEWYRVLDENGEPLGWVHGSIVR